MTNEEMHRAMEFIIQQQAQYAARLEKDEPRLATLEESFTMLVELARRAGERQDTMGETVQTRSLRSHGRALNLKRVRQRMFLIFRLPRMIIPNQERLEEHEE